VSCFDSPAETVSRQRGGDGGYTPPRSLKGEVSWFGVGLPLVKAGKKVRADSPVGDPESVQANEVAAAGDVERNGGQGADHRESVETIERIYLPWPWKSNV